MMSSVSQPSVSHYRGDTDELGGSMCYDDSFESGGFECLCNVKGKDFALDFKGNGGAVTVSRTLTITCYDCGQGEFSKFAWTVAKGDELFYVCNDCGNKRITDGGR